MNELLKKASTLSTAHLTSLSTSSLVGAKPPWYVAPRAPGDRVTAPTPTPTARASSQGDAKSSPRVTQQTIGDALSPAQDTMMRHVAGKMGLDPRTIDFRCQKLGAPVAYSIQGPRVRPTIVVSNEALQHLSHGGLRWLVGHEASHIKHHDARDRNWLLGLGAVAIGRLASSNPRLAVPAAIISAAVGLGGREVWREVRADVEAAVRLGTDGDPDNALGAIRAHNLQARTSDKEAAANIDARGNDWRDLPHPPLSWRQKLLSALPRVTNESLGDTAQVGAKFVLGRNSGDCLFPPAIQCVEV